MIITANGTPHTVNIDRKFTPVYSRKIEFFNSLNGKTQASDRGASSDKYGCSFTVTDDTSIVNELVNDLYLNTGQLTIDTDGAKIFGAGIDHSGTFECNLLNEPSYPIRDLKTATILIKVRVVSEILYNASITPSLPELLYKWPISRSVNVQKSNFDSSAFGDYGTVTRVDFANVPLKSEIAKFTTRMNDSDFGKLHRYVAEQRGNTIAINTNVCLELFLNSTNNDVKITGFTYSPDGFNRWNVSLTLVNNV